MDIVERLEAHMGLALIQDVLPDCREAAILITDLRARFASLEAMCADLAKALEGIVKRSENGELGTSKVQDMKRTALEALAAYRKERSDV